MTNRKKIEISAVIALFILLLIVSLYGYFGLLSPIEAKIETVDSEILQQQTFLKKMEEHKEVTPVQVENTFSLQEQVPVEPLVDQFLLQFEKAEVLSDSLILSMQFSDGEAKEREDDEAGDTNEEVNQEADESQTNEQLSNDATSLEGNEEIQSEEKTEPATAPEVLPEGVKKVTVEVSVVSKDYQGLLKFLRTIEDLKRISVIESITFTGQDELDLAAADAVTDQFQYDIKIAAYYLPELTEYVRDLPRSDFPAPNGKENPLTNGEDKN